MVIQIANQSTAFLKEDHQAYGLNHLLAYFIYHHDDCVIVRMVILNRILARNNYDDLFSAMRPIAARVKQMLLSPPLVAAEHPYVHVYQ